MENITPRRTHRIRLLVAMVGIAALIVVWSRLGSGDLPPSSAGDAVPVVVEATAPPAPTVVVPDSQPPAPPLETSAKPIDPSEQPSPQTPLPVLSTEESEAAQRDAEIKAQLIGVWLHAENGDQWIENREDGTSRMLLKLDFVPSLLYGKETAMELSWSLKDGILSHTVLSGAPEKNLESLVKAFGKTREYTILETTPERMLLESKDQKKKKELWTRMPAPKEWTK